MCRMASWPAAETPEYGFTGPHRMAWEEGHLVTWPLASAFFSSSSLPSSSPHPQTPQSTRDALHDQKVLSVKLILVSYASV